MQANTEEDISKATALIKEIIQEPFESLILSSGSVFGKWGELNTFESLCMDTFHVDGDLTSTTQTNSTRCTTKTTTTTPKTTTTSAYYIPCPSSECWDYVNGSCSIKLDSVGNPVCATVSCDYNKLAVTFENNLFGVNGDTTDPWGVGPALATPTYNHQQGHWTLDCPLGDCNMEVGQEEKNGDE